MSALLHVPHGGWPAPVSAEALAVGTLGFEELIVDGDDVYWVEARPDDGGRSVIVTRDAHGRTNDILAQGLSVGSRVHEYGGCAVVAGAGVVYFVDRASQRVHRIDRPRDRPRPEVPPPPLTAEGAMRFGDLAIDAPRRRLLAVCEDHTHSDLRPRNSIVAIPVTGGVPETLVEGNDFYLAPRPSPDGASVAFLTWNHPNMPWDSTELWLARCDAQGRLIEPRRIAGGADESVCHPEWSPDGRLYFISDRTGWWNLYRLAGDRIEAVAPMAADLGAASAMGHVPYAFAGASRVVGRLVRNGIMQLAGIDVATGKVETYETGCSVIHEPRVAGGKAVFFGGSPHAPISLFELDLATRALVQLRRPNEVDIDPGFFRAPEPIAFPTEDGGVAHGFYYPPCHPSVAGPPGSRPPLIVNAHGGPVGVATTALRFGLHALAAPVFWTSRGFAVLDVNYRGSTGFGRAYRQHLYGRWGEVDVDDCIAGARYLVHRGDVDPARLVIRGGSAGGYTTMAALAFRDVFAAGAAYFGVSDLEVFRGETHKYESHYDQQLIGRWPEARELYRQRSPIHAADRVRAPLLLLHGLDDRVIPPNQSELLFRALVERGKPVAHLAFPGEGHGFRQATTLQRSLRAEASFYRRVLGITNEADVPPDEVSLQIQHFPG
jgi:dipeptidyl aminopeptidase/acylaminoacyl peptidase